MWPIVFAAVIAFGLLVVIPVVAIMAEHQRKMARIMSGQAEDKSDHGQVVIGVHAGLGDRRKGRESERNEVLDELRALRGEIADLRLQVASLQGDRLPPLPRDDSVRDRLSHSS